MKENQRGVFTLEEEQELARLLKKIPENGGFIPDPAFFPFHACTSVWAPELVICKHTLNRAPEVLLIPYEGGESHWAKNRYRHLPGGHHKRPDREPPNIGMGCGSGGFHSIQGAVSRIAKRKLGVDVKIRDIIDIYWWPPPSPSGWREERGEHPHGLPMSIFVKCEVVEKLTENEKIKFFSVDNLPSPLVLPHKWFLEWHFFRKPFPNI